MMSRVFCLLSAATLQAKAEGGSQSHSSAKRPQGMHFPLLPFIYFGQFSLREA
jgi:hypothetical protein